MSNKPSTVLDARALDRTLRRMADQIIELNAGTEGLVLVGIQRRGVQLAERIGRIIETQEGATIARGALDITLYRDDLQTVGPRPVVGATHLPWTLDGQNVVIVDDVLYTGRTVRAALNLLFDYGRPGRVRLAALLDRGGRQLPIAPDFVGGSLDLADHHRMIVLARDDAGQLSLAMEDAGVSA